jgi:TPR repeat protein
LNAVACFESAAAEDALCQYMLGECYERGNGVPQDAARAVHCYRIATVLRAAAIDGDEDDKVLDVIQASTLACARLAQSRELAAACCLGCGETRKLKTCARCRVARFCCTECVREAWVAHKPMCLLWAAGSV